MAGREIGGNNESGATCASKPAECRAQLGFDFLWSCLYRRASPLDFDQIAGPRPASDCPFGAAPAGLFSLAGQKLPSTGNQSVMKQCGAQWWQAAKAKSMEQTGDRRNLATVPESLPGAARLNDKRSAAGRIYASATSSTGSRAFASTDSIVSSRQRPSNSARWKRRTDRRWICPGPGSSVSLSRINCRLGQCAFTRLPFPLAPAITATRKAGPICARRRLSFRQSRSDERTSSLAGAEKGLPFGLVA